MRCADGVPVLQTLLDSIKYMPQAYPDLHPSQPDSEGNTILHQAMKVPYSNRALEVVILICSYKIDPHVRNAMGKLALDCIAAGMKDRRVGYVRGLMKTQTAVSARNAPTNDDELDAEENDTEYISNTRPRQDDARVKTVVADKEMDANECRLFLRSAIDSMTNYVYDLFGEEDTDGSTKKLPTKGGGEASEINSVSKTESVGIELITLQEEIIKEVVEGDEQVALDEKIFDGLEWEVECTAEVWKFLSNHQVPERAKSKMIGQLRQLASGDWSSELCQPIENVSEEISLFEIRLTENARIVWQLVVAFSPRRSETDLLAPSVGEGSCAIRGCVYSEVIRVWDVPLNAEQRQLAVERAVKSNLRGKECIIQRQLIGIGKEKKENLGDCNVVKRLPRLWTDKISVGDSKVKGKDDGSEQDVVMLYPPGSANEKEYHIMKFYAFDSSLVGTALRGESAKVDFPFRVTELEYAIISLRPNPPAPVILLGRSGTGKTTCCLYRLWSNFVRYWTRAVEIGEPWIPRTVDFKPIGELRVIILSYLKLLVEI
jgi:hypothetical protein